MRRRHLAVTVVVALCLSIGGVIWWSREPVPDRSPEEGAAVESAVPAVRRETAAPVFAVPPESRPVPATVNPLVRRLTDTSEDGEPGPERFALLKLLAAETLTAEDRFELYEFLRHGPNDTVYHALKNDIINCLRNQDPPSADLTPVLLELAGDKNQDRVVRVYALQHLRPWYRLQNQRSEEVRQAFFDALEERDTELAGTALLAMNYLSRELPEFDPAFIGRMAVDIAADPKASHLSRASAIQVAVERQAPVREGFFRSLATGTEPLPVRLAATGALGRSGDPADRESLELLAAEDGPVGRAARSALRKLDKISD